MNGFITTFRLQLHQTMPVRRKGVTNHKKNHSNRSRKKQESDDDFIENDTEPVTSEYLIRTGSHL